MGYTHYWSHDEELDRAALSHALADVAKIVRGVQDRGIALRGPDGTGDPELTEFRVAFNGDAEQDEDYESFSFPIQGEEAQRARHLHGGLWAFCKTARMPYDLAVCAALLVFKHHLGGQMRVSSDGGREEDEWLPAEALVQEVLGYEVIYKREETLG
ncbi:MAG: hypothetical protein Q8P22_11105 [Chloroflexota bacterium]|nr:hypothetical protein [Chloroflexota bacterium]